jgi:hypothetical protein
MPDIHVVAHVKVVVNTDVVAQVNVNVGICVGVVLLTQADKL